MIKLYKKFNIERFLKLIILKKTKKVYVLEKNIKISI